MQFQFNDGGRKAAGYRGEAGDCFARAVSIVTERPYRDIYALINDVSSGEKYKRGRAGFLYAVGRGSSARTGVYKQTARNIMADLGFVWHPTMQVGQGCKVHLRTEELPTGRIVVSLSRHFAAVIDGVLHDTYDCSRNGTRCVYGYWSTLRCNKCHRPMLGTTAYDGACECGGLITSS